MENAWLDLGLLDQTQLRQLSKDLSNAAKTVSHTLIAFPGSVCSVTLLLLIPSAQAEAQKSFVKFSKALGGP